MVLGKSLGEGADNKEQEKTAKADKEAIAVVADIKTATDTADKLEQLIERAVDKAMSKQENAAMQTKGAISSSLPLADKGASWDSGAAIAAVKKWASNDDGDIDFSKYKKAFMWVEGGGGDKQGDYKLPFATVSDGKLVAVWNAVKAIMAVLNGGRGGVDIPEADRKSVYTQVKKYYKKFDEDVPPLKDLDTEDTDEKSMLIGKEDGKELFIPISTEKGKKGGVADEIAEENAYELKRQKMGSVFEVFWAFCDVYFDEGTDAADFNKLLDETTSLFQKISAGTYNGGPAADDDDDEGGVVVASVRSLKSVQAKSRFAQFFVKLLTGETLQKDNILMGKKDLSEGTNGGAALTPVQFGKLKEVHDFLLNTKEVLDAHADALAAHAKTMKVHADMVAKQSKAAGPHADILKGIIDVVKGRVDDNSDETDVPDAALDDDDGSGLTESTAPDNSLTRLSGKPSETKAEESKAEDEVKSEEVPTDGADPSKKSEATVTKTNESEETKQEQPSKEETLDEGKTTAEKEKSVSKQPLTDDTEVDEDNLTDEQAEEIVKAVNEALAEAQKK